MDKSLILTLALIMVWVFGYGAQNIFAEENEDAFYVPLIGITSVPEPLALPDGSGTVTYHYAVKNFLREVPLTDVYVFDDTCSPVTFVEGDDNYNSMLEYDETWRYVCVTQLLETTQSVAVVTGHANTIAATHRAYATVVVGSDSPAPLVSVINITKVAYPLSLPTEGGEISFTYKVNNPGLVPLGDVTISDDKCNAMSGKLGDTNYNNLLDVQEVWIYTCTMTLTETTTNTVRVTAYANGLKAVGEAVLTIKVDTPSEIAVPGFPNVGGHSDPKITVWILLLGILAVLTLFLTFTTKRAQSFLNKLPFRKGRQKEIK